MRISIMIFILFISHDVNYYEIIFDGRVSELKDKLARDPLESA